MNFVEKSVFGLVSTSKEENQISLELGLFQTHPMLPNSSKWSNARSIGNHQDRNFWIDPDFLGKQRVGLMISVHSAKKILMISSCCCENSMYLLFKVWNVLEELRRQSVLFLAIVCSVRCQTDDQIDRISIGRRIGNAVPSRLHWMKI